MIFEGKKFEEINQADLENLIAFQFREGKFVDYKREPSLAKPLDKKEFLADVSSFANTSGGHLLIGMEENNGVPTAISPINLNNPDQEIARLDHLSGAGIRPRIYGLKIHPVKIGEKYVLVIRVPKSWQGLHMITFDGHDRFYGRNSHGKYPLDVEEIRGAFSLFESGYDRIRNFRADRIAKIIGNVELPVETKENLAKGVLHIIPFSMIERYDN